MVGVVLLILLIIMAIFGPYMTGYDYSTNDLVNKNQPPSSDHWFGTDDLGVMYLRELGKGHEFPYLLVLQRL